MVLVSIFISILAIIISVIPILTDICEDFSLPDWRIFKTDEERGVRGKKEKEKSIVEEWIKKYNVPTELQKDLGAVTDKYFLVKMYKYGDYYWIYSRQPDGALGERRGVITFYNTISLPGAFFELDDLNKMCDEEVQAESLKRRGRIMRKRVDKLNS